jgi:NAD(P)-dependent dehydrogenase (short-subunit alcohol dehydrogenase family)
MDLGLSGKHAIVTGGSLGIGKAIARELAREGVDVAIVARSREQLAATARELESETGRRIIPMVADVTSKEQVDGMVAQAAERLGAPMHETPGISAAGRAMSPSCTLPRPWPCSWAATGSRSTASTPA